MHFKALLPVAFIALAGCGSTATAPSTETTTREAKTYAAGEKATIGPLTYAIVDSQVLPRLGDDPAAFRIPTNRFYIIQVSISNSSENAVAIPTMTLVGDDGATYQELTDGAGVPKWLGIVRKVAANDTEAGYIVFDAPAKHYKLKLSDEFATTEAYSDLPLTFQANDVSVPPTPMPTGLDTAQEPAAPAQKKK